MVRRVIPLIQVSYLCNIQNHSVLDFNILYYNFFFFLFVPTIILMLDAYLNSNTYNQWYIISTKSGQLQLQCNEFI